MHPLLFLPGPQDLWVSFATQCGPLACFQASGITHDVIGAAIEVREDKGPGKLVDEVNRLILPGAKLE